MICFAKEFDEKCNDHINSSAKQAQIYYMCKSLWKPPQFIYIGNKLNIGSGWLEHKLEEEK